MKRLDRILAVLDPTASSQPALAKAVTLARRSGAALEVFICDFDPSLSGQPVFDTDKLRQLRALRPEHGLIPEFLRMSHGRPALINEICGL